MRFLQWRLELNFCLLILLILIKRENCWSKIKEFLRAKESRKKQRSSIAGLVSPFPPFFFQLFPFAIVLNAEFLKTSILEAVLTVLELPETTPVVHQKSG